MSNIYGNVSGNVKGNVIGNAFGSGTNPSLWLGMQTSLLPFNSAGSGTPTFTRASTAYVPGYADNAVVTDSPTALLLASGEAGFWGARRIAENSWSMYDANGVLLVPANGASVAVCDALGNFGYFSGGARADVLGTTAAIRRKMTDAGWVSGGGGIAVGDAVGFDGGATSGASLTATGANGTILFTTVLGAAVRTYSAWVRRKTGTGTVNITGDNGVTWTPITLTTAYKQFTFTTASAANPVVGFRIVTSADAIEVDFNTLEQATFANPTPIPVNVSKAADVLTYPSAGNVSGTVGSAYAEVTIPATAAQGLVPYFVDLGNNRPALYENNPGPTINIFDGNATVSGPVVTVPATSPIKIASVWSGSSMQVFSNGSAGTAGAFDGDMNAGANITIGGQNATSAQPFGTIRNVRIWKSALPTLQLIGLTT